MILGFSTQINNRPTYFVEKIQTALRLPYFKDSVGFHEGFVPPNFNFYVKSKCKPKLHTIREDKTDRWHAGTKIDFFINVRKKDMFRFAPVMPVVSTQKVEILYKGLFKAVIIDNDLFYTDCDNNLGEGKKRMLELAQNDGFDSMEDFFEYFNEDFKGKIIHWTDLKY